LIGIFGKEITENKKPGFITSIRTGRGNTGTTMQIYKNNG